MVTVAMACLGYCKSSMKFMPTFIMYMRLRGICFCYLRCKLDRSGQIISLPSIVL